MNTERNRRELPVYLAMKTDGAAGVVVVTYTAIVTARTLRVQPLNISVPTIGIDDDGEPMIAEAIARVGYLYLEDGAERRIWGEPDSRWIAAALTPQQALLNASRVWGTLAERMKKLAEENYAAFEELGHLAYLADAQVKEPELALVVPGIEKKPEK